MFNHVRKQKQSLHRVDDKNLLPNINNDCKTLSDVGIIFVQQKGRCSVKM